MRYNSSFTTAERHAMSSSTLERAKGLIDQLSDDDRQALLRLARAERFAKGGEKPLLCRAQQRRLASVR